LWSAPTATGFCLQDDAWNALGVQDVTAALKAVSF
jgi:hypothetical protein